MPVLVDRYRGTVRALHDRMFCSRYALVVLALTATACGGVAHGDGSGGVAGATGGAAGGSPAGDGSARTIPTKNGVPIGDCVDPSASALAAAGCPTAQPPMMSACGAPAGTVCRYEIQTEPGYSQQAVFVCSDKSWGPGVLNTCGQICQLGVAATSPPAQIVDLQGGACASRPVTECQGVPGTQYWAPAQTAQTRLNEQLRAQIAVCYGSMQENSIQVQVIDGCPVRLTVQAVVDASVIECLTTGLATQRWSCAMDLVCAQYSMFYL
jgi:hypothetical protein